MKASAVVFAVALIASAASAAPLPEVPAPMPWPDRSTELQIMTARLTGTWAVIRTDVTQGASTAEHLTVAAVFESYGRIHAGGGRDAACVASTTGDTITCKNLGGAYLWSFTGLATGYGSYRGVISYDNGGTAPAMMVRTE